MKMACRAIKFSSKLKELRIHLCQNSSSSKGVREFVEKYYVSLKKANPQFPILIRECSGIQPVLWARYDFGEERSVPLDNLEAEHVFNKVEKVNSKC